MLHFGLTEDHRPTENQASANVRLSTSTEAVALYEEWVGVIPADGSIDAPKTTPYGMVEWPLLDPNRNLFRVGGPAESR